MKKTIKSALCLTLASAALLCSCKARNYAPLEPVTIPEIERAEGYIDPVRNTAYEGTSITLTPVIGPKLTVYDSSSVELILQDYAVERMKLGDVGEGEMLNTLTVNDANGDVVHTFSLSSDSQGILKSESGRMIAMPEYAYYSLQYALWASAGSLSSNRFKWDEQSGSTAIFQSYLPDIIKTVRVQAYGYAMAYFTNYKLYGYTLADNGSTLKLYMYVTFAGYNLSNGAFSPVIEDSRPVQLILTLDEDKCWRATTWKESATPSSYDSIRTVLSYDYAKLAREDYAARETFFTDLDRQALDYLRKYNITGVNIAG